MAKLSLRGSNFDQLPMFTPETDWVAPTQLPDLSQVREIAVDTETRDDGLKAERGPGWHAQMGYIAGIGVAWSGGHIYVPVRHPDSPNFDRSQVGAWLRDLFAQSHTRFVFHNAGYDLGWIETDFGVKPPAQIDDTGAMAAMVDENRRPIPGYGSPYSLNALCYWRGVPTKNESRLKEAAAAYGFGDDVKSNIWRLPARFVGPYGEGDPASTLLLAQSLRPEIEAQGMGEAYQLEADLVPMVIAMRRKGIRVNVEKAEALAARFQNQRNQVLKELSDRIGHTTDLHDIRSNRWLQQAFDNEKVSYPRSPQGYGSFEATWMRKHPHWLPRMVSQAKQLEDMASKFLRGFIVDYAHMGRLHATINQFRAEGGGTRSHRVSYSDPPLQQIPSRDDELAPLIRGVFEPEPGEIWGALDYSQQEYRLIVHFAELLKLRKASVAGDMYRKDPKTDFHELVVKMTGLIRRRAKDTNFAKAFGAGIPKFAEMTGMSLEEAKATMEQYDEELPFVKEEGEKCQSLAQKRGFIRLIDGARAHFESWEPRWRDNAAEALWLKANPNGRGTFPCDHEEAKARTQDPGHPWYHEQLQRADARKAMNRLIQGSAARQTKLAMRAQYREGYLPAIQMHDELSHSFSDYQAAVRCAEIMRDVVTLTVPVMVDAEFGVTWGRAAKVKDKSGQVIYGATWEDAVAERDAMRKFASFDGAN